MERCRLAMMRALSRADGSPFFLPAAGEKARVESSAPPRELLNIITGKWGGGALESLSFFTVLFFKNSKTGKKHFFGRNGRRIARKTR